MDSSFMKFVSQFLIVTMLALGLPLGAANAALIGTEVVATAQQASLDRERVREYFSRQDVQKQLQAFGVNAQNAKDRVAAMTDEEVQKLAGKIDSMPAAGSSSNGWAVALAVLVVILIVTEATNSTCIFHTCK